MSGRMRVVLVGYGPVGARFVEELLPAVRHGSVELTVVGAEDGDAYNRVLIADYAVGRTDRAALGITDTPAAVQAGVRLLTGLRVTAIDTGMHTVALSTGESLGYDRLVLATGSRATVPTLDGVERIMRDRRALTRAGEAAIAHDQPLPPGITTLRDLGDAARVRSLVDASGRLVVLGAGVLGLEIALAAATEGAKVSVVHHGSHPMPRNLDRGGGTVLADSLRTAGIEVVAHTRAEGVIFHTGGDGIPCFGALSCADGKTIGGDLLLLSCGVSPRTELATLAGLPVSAGILVDAGLRSWGDDDVYAIGDCAHVVPLPDRETVSARMSAGVRGAPSGLIGPGWRQAEWLAGRLAAEAGGPAAVGVVAEVAGSVGLAPERPAVVMLKAERVDVVSAGVVDAEPWDRDPLEPTDARHPLLPRRVSQWADPEHGRYVKMVTRGGVLEGLVSVGMPRTGAELMLLFERGSELPADRSVLLRHDGPDFTPAATSAAPQADETVCWCNGVTVAHIHAAVAEGNTTVECVGSATRAGTGCGGCKGRVAELIERFSGSGDPVGAGV